MENCGMLYYGKLRHVDIEKVFNGDERWTKPRIKHNDDSQVLRIVCDYRTHEFVNLNKIIIR